jgi:hypothetical protein
MFSQKAAQALQAIGVSPDKTAEMAAVATAAKNPKINTPAELAFTATDPALNDQQRANAGLQRLNAYQQAGRPINNNILPGLAPGGAGATLTGDAYLNTVSPSLAAMVKAIAEGRSQMPSGATRSAAAVQLRDAVFHYDPSYSDQRAQVRKAFTTGPDGRNIGNLNTAAVHLDALGEISKAMDNESFQPGNAMYNALATQLGAAPPNNYEGLRQAVAGEMDAALHGTSTIPGRADIAATIPAKSAPGQISGAVSTNLRTLAQKLNTYKERYEQQSPNDSIYSPILPSAKAVFDKYNAAPASGAGGGAKVYTQADVDAAVRAHPGLTAAQAGQAFASKGWVKK